MSNATPIAVVFHDPDGRKSYPYPDVYLSVPGLCKLDFQMHPITFAYADGGEIGYDNLTEAEDYYKRLVPKWSYQSWHTEGHGCPFLQSLLKLPWLPPGLGELSARWAKSLTESHHFGQVGVRDNFDLIYVETDKQIEGDYGMSYRHIFRLESGERACWWTGKQCIIPVGEKRTIRATVKAHDSDKGTPLTQLTRCSPLKGEDPLTVEVERGES